MTEESTADGLFSPHKAVIGNWQVELGGRERHFRISYANTFDEPLGGLMNVILASDGQHYRHTEINNGRSLVIDIGGHTTDWLGVNPGGEVDYSLARSVPIGIQDVVADFAESFRANNLQAVKDIAVLPPDRVRSAIATGVFDGAGRQYPCENESREATSVLLNRIADTYQRIAGGALGWDQHYPGPGVAAPCSTSACCQYSTMSMCYWPTRPRASIWLTYVAE